MNNNILKLADKFYKLAQLQMGANEAVKDKIETFTKSFIEKLFDKHINDINAPQDDLVEMKFIVTTQIGEDKVPKFKLAVTGNTPQIQKWAQGIFVKNSALITSKIKEILAGSKFTLPFDSEATVNRKYE